MLAILCVFFFDLIYKLYFLCPRRGSWCQEFPKLVNDPKALGKPESAGCVTPLGCVTLGLPWNHDNGLLGLLVYVVIIWVIIWNYSVFFLNSVISLVVLLILFKTSYNMNV